MKLQDAVNSVSASVKLPPSVTSYLQNNRDEFEVDNNIKGGVLRDFKFAWLANGSKFVVINIKTGHKIAAWTFGGVLRDFKTSVMCVCEIPPLIENTKQLLVGLECDMIGGLVCLFHCQGSRVLRAIRLDCRVSCIQFVDRFPSGPLQCFDGVVVIGTHGGSALAFDLNRRSCIDAIIYGKTGRENLIKDELNIGNLFTLSLDDINLIEEQRAIACEKDDHIAIQINEGCFHNLQYILHGPNNSVRLRATRERVFVTSLLYIPQLASVVVGFNFGAFQLWNMLTMELEYTSPVSTDQSPISHFGFLEPCDDPRAFSYLWVIYSSLDRLDEGFPLAAMYAFSYQGKTSLRDGVFFYQNFISCNLRFNVELSSVDSPNFNVKQMVGGRCISCHTLSKSVGKSKDSEESILNLCQLVWECWTVSAIAPVQSVMMVFDIDQWYKEQMPELTTLESNSFLSVVNLGDTLTHTASCSLCDVRINNDSLAPFYSVPRLEEHYYPNSLGYDCVCLSNTDVTHLKTVGVQRQLLSNLNDVGPSVLLHPSKVFLQCLACGLVPLYVDPHPNVNTHTPLQREMILSVALEARLISFLSDCARDWATGSHSSLGCSLSSFIKWAWTRSLTLKSNADQLTTPLFDHSGDGPDANSVNCLESCTRQFGLMAKLLNIMLDKFSNLMLPKDIKELKGKQRAVQLVSLYFQVVQWFLNVGLLPEFSMSSQHSLERNADRLPYPLNSLVRYYQNRRLKLHCLNGENPALENVQNKLCPLLFIDQFMETECDNNKLKKLWCDDGSEINGLYPPPSLHSLLRTYLVPGITDENKHSLVLYTLVDYAMTFDEARYETVIRRLMQFPTMFGLSSNAIKITQAFWHLDHRDFELALDQLESVVAGGWLKEWQHNVALSSLLVQNKTQAALQYLYVRKPLLPLSSKEGIISNDDWETCCNLYLSRGLLLEAFNLTKDSAQSLSSADVKEQRMIIFLEGCKKMNLLSKVLALPLTDEEEIILTNFLKALGDSDAHDLLVMYYLQRSRFIEAQHVNDDLKRLSSKGQLPYDVSSDFSSKKDHIPKTKTRDELVNMYCKTLPKVTRNLANMASQYILPSRMTMPTPMTVNLQAATPKHATYRSSVIQATINKANETWLERPSVVKNLKRALQIEDTPFICTPKMERHSSRLNDFEKMITTPEDIYTSPAKRPRLEQKNELSCTTPEDPALIKEVGTLLHTPVVERKSHWRCDSMTDSTREATPQSILKVRTRLLDCSASFDERHYVETDEEFDTASLNTQSDNLSRSIRFNIPSPGNTPSPSITPTDLNESFEELSQIEAFSQTSFKNIALPIKSSTEKSIQTPDITTPVKRSPLRGRVLISPSISSEPSCSHSEVQSIIEKEYVSETFNVGASNEGIEQAPVATDLDMEEAQNEEERSSPALSERLKRGPQPRRSLRSTPEREKETILPRILRSRSKTPESQIIRTPDRLSPSKKTPAKVKKSLARIVLESNALSVSKTVVQSESISESFSRTIQTKTEENSFIRHSVTNKLIESMYSHNESLLASDLSEADSDISTQTEVMECDSFPIDAIVDTKLSSTRQEIDLDKNEGVDVLNSDENEGLLCNIVSNVHPTVPEENIPFIEDVDNNKPVTDSQYQYNDDDTEDLNVANKDDSLFQNIVNKGDTEPSNVANKDNSLFQNIDNKDDSGPSNIANKDNSLFQNIDNKDDSGPSNIVNKDDEVYQNIDNKNDTIYDNMDDTETLNTDNKDDTLYQNIGNMDDNQDATIYVNIDNKIHTEDPSIDNKVDPENRNIDNKIDKEDPSIDNKIDTEHPNIDNDTDSQSPYHEDIVDTECVNIEYNADMDCPHIIDDQESTHADINLDVAHNIIPHESQSTYNQLEDFAVVETENDEIYVVSSLGNQDPFMMDTGEGGDAMPEHSNTLDPIINIEARTSPLGSNESLLESEHDTSESSEDEQQSVSDDVKNVDANNLGDSENSRDNGSQTDTTGTTTHTSDQDSSSCHTSDRDSDVIHILSSDDEGCRKDLTDVSSSEEDNKHITVAEKTPTDQMQTVSNMDEPIILKLSEDEENLDEEEILQQSCRSETIPCTGASVADREIQLTICDPPVETNVEKEIEYNAKNIITSERVLSTVSESYTQVNPEQATTSCSTELEGCKSDSLEQEDHSDQVKIDITTTEGEEMDAKEEPLQNVDVGVKTNKNDDLRTGPIQDVVSASESPIEMSSSVHSENVDKKSKEISTPSRILRRRSSSKSEVSSPSVSLIEKIVEHSPIHVTRSASKRRQQSSSGSPNGSERSYSTFDDSSSVISNASSSRKSAVIDSSSPYKQHPESRKSRRSTMATIKSNLSVIPEVSQSELEKSDVSNLETTTIEQYLSSKRLTRNQKSMLEKSFSNASATNTPQLSKKSRRPSTSSSNLTDENLQIDTESEISERDMVMYASQSASNTHETPAKRDKDGTKSPSEHHLETASVSSRSSVIDNMNTPSASDTERIKRADSEATGTAEQPKKARRLSVDESITESPGRPRRQSFNKAVEALSTPKRKRRISTDSKNDTDGESDTSMSDRMTPNIFKEQMNQSKLMAIEENEIEEDDKETNLEENEESVVKPAIIPQRKKPASNKASKTEILKSRARMSQLLSPLSKEEQEDLGQMDKPRHRRRTTMHKVIQPIEFVVKKK